MSHCANHFDTKHDLLAWQNWCLFLRPLVTSEDLEVSWYYVGWQKWLRSISLIEPIILIPNMTKLHGQNLWLIFEVTGDLEPPIGATNDDLSFFKLILKIIRQSLWRLTPSMLHFLHLVSQCAEWAGHAKDLPGPLLLLLCYFHI